VEKPNQNKKNSEKEGHLTHWLPVYEYILFGNLGTARDISVVLPTA